MTSPPPRPGPRLVVLAGPSGSGKTTLCELGHAVMAQAWGCAAAAVDVDRLYANVDPLWELPYDHARNTLMLQQAGGLALSLFEHGWATVLVCGNSLFAAEDVATLVAAVRTAGAVVHHVTLLPDTHEVLRRCAGDPGRDPQRLLADHRVHRSRVHPGSAVLDAAGSSPRETLRTLVRLVDAGEGRIA